MATQITKKISMKVLVGNIKATIKPLADKSVLPIAKIAGIANGSKAGESTYGPWLALLGNFVATPLSGDNLGKTFRSGQLFLPDVALDMVRGAVENLNKGESVQFAFQINALVDTDSQQGYVYTAELIMEPEENDPLEALIKKAGVLALPAIETEKPSEPIATPEKSAKK